MSDHAEEPALSQLAAPAFELLGRADPRHGFRLVADLMQRLGGGEDPRVELQLQLLTLQIEKMRHGQLPPVISLGLDQVLEELGERQDWVIVGERGYGKTALGSYVGQNLAEGAACFGFPTAIAAELGFQPVTADQVRHLEDTCLVVDEAGTGFGSSLCKTPAQARDVLSFARHRNVSTVWIAQHASQIAREVLRFGAVWAFKYLDPTAIMFDRSELSELLASIVSIQTRYEELQEPDGVVLMLRGRPYVTRNPLPAGWSEVVSKHGGV